MHDAHLHVEDIQFLNQLREYNFPCIINAASKREYDFLKMNQYSNMYISCGIHPWYVQITNRDEIVSCISQADFLGEIGLDLPWCDTPYDLQKEALLFQLSHFNKPTILHTKGYEKEILDMIRLFPRKYLVHWYSCNQYIDEYIQLNCYFTIGPSILNDENYRNIVSKIPLDRLLIETDGIEAIKWALNKDISNNDYFMIIKQMISELAKVKNIHEKKLICILENNFNALTCN